MEASEQRRMSQLPAANPDEIQGFSLEFCDFLFGSKEQDKGPGKGFMEVFGFWGCIWG